MKRISNLPSRRDKNGHLTKWAIFWCDVCKTEVEKQLENGLRAKSCGFLKCKENKGENNPSYKHGETNTKLHTVWTNIKQRCNNPKHKSYKDYGGRGITVCPEWVESYILFRNWALYNGYANNLVIDRKNPDGNYEPSNCRFITILESLRNRTNTTTIQIANEIRALYATGKYTHKELAEKYNLHVVTVSQIINNKIWKN